MTDGLPDQFPFLPVEEIIKPAQEAQIKPGNGKRQEVEEKTVHFHLKKLAQS
jgi:hypothetical protein